MRTPASKYVAGTKVRHVAVVRGPAKLPTATERRAWLEANPRASLGEVPVQVGRVLFFEEVTSRTAGRKAAERAATLAKVCDSIVSSVGAVNLLWVSPPCQPARSIPCERRPSDSEVKS